jgi:hypothetical protein
MYGTFRACHSLSPHTFVILLKSVISNKTVSIKILPNHSTDYCNQDDEFFYQRLFENNSREQS